MVFAASVAGGLPAGPLLDLYAKVENPFDRDYYENGS